MMRTQRLTAAATASLLAVALGTAAGVPGIAGSALAAAPANYAICPDDPAQPLTEPEALQSVDAYTTDGSAYAQQLATGSGVKVAVLGDGLDPDNPDFIRPTGQHAITDYQDFSGVGPDAPSAGTLSFGAAAAIAAQGVVTYDLSDFVNSSYPLPPGCNIRIRGVAPGASIVALRVGEKDAASVSSIVQAINYAVTVAHVNVIDEPFAQAAFPDSSSRDAIEQSNHQAVAAGVTVVEASGDSGPNGTIGSDAADPSVVSVGASTDGQPDAQTGAGGARFFGNGQWLDDSDSGSSSGGVSQSGRTVDLIAPGSDNWGVCEAGFSGCDNFNGGQGAIQDFGGTGEASAVTSGAAALVISAYRSAHGGHSPSPAVVKQLLTGTASDLGLPPAEQGSGLLNADAATEAALTWPGATKSAPAGVRAQLVMSRDQLTIAADPGKAASGTVSVRNIGAKTLTVAVGTRQMQPDTTSAQAVAFDASTLPTFPDPTSGAPRAYKQVHFSVPTGAAELTAHMAWAGTRSGMADAVMRLTLLDPSGQFIGASEPQGRTASPNWAEVEAQQPAAGTWTAVMTSPAGSSGYTGTVGLLTSSEKAIPVGSVNPAGFTLKPNQSRAVTVRDKLPKVSAGDQSYALTVASSAGQQTAVGVVARPLLDPGHSQGSFSGEITGGDGEPDAPAQTMTYPITVPSSATGLDASVRFIETDNGEALLTPGEPVEAMLIDPHGNLADLVSNNTLSDPGTEAPGAQIQAFVARPAAGRWLLVVAAANPIPGTEFEQDFTGQVRLRGLSVRPTGLPSSPKTLLKPGSVHTVKLRITNNGVQPLLLGLDARTGKYATYQPLPVTGQDTLALPASASNEPTYSVPPDTRSLTVTASSSQHTQTEIHASGGGIDAVADRATAARSSLSSAKATEPATGSFLVRGLWATSLQEVGPFSDDGQPSGQSTLTASLSTLSFNPTIHAAVDDPYRDALLGTDSVPPIFLKPGQTTTITAHLTVRGPRGASVSGLINLVTLPSQPTRSSNSLPARTTGEVVATLPFRYSVTPLRLSAHAPRSVRRGQQLVLTVTHARAPVHGVTVRFEGHSTKTKANGKAIFTVSHHAKTGKVKVTSTRRGYTRVVTTVIVKP